MTDAERLIALLNSAAEDMENTEIKADGLSPEFEPLGEAVCSCLLRAQEVIRFSAGMADGDLSAPVPNRGNLMAGPIKDLFYKLQHLKWQAEQISKGDYTQHVDFMGDFAVAFNSMTRGLKSREDTISEQTEEKLRMTKRDNLRLERQMDRQHAHFQAYREYTDSFYRFRELYKQMMGEVYALFDKGKYENGRQLIARINDMMGSEVAIHMGFSDNESINTLLAEISAFCRQHDVEFHGAVHVPEGFISEEMLTPVKLSHIIEFLYALLESSDADGRKLSVRSLEKGSWLSVVVRYNYAGGDRPPENDPDFTRDMDNVLHDLELAGALSDFHCHAEIHEMIYVFNIPRLS